jgi:hypothetical protein
MRLSQKIEQRVLIGRTRHGKIAEGKPLQHVPDTRRQTISAGRGEKTRQPFFFT